MWIISDVRRKTDIKWFIENFGDACRTVRIVCPEEVRRKRGWIYTPGNNVVILIIQPNLFGESNTFESLQTVNLIAAGIDDSETECDLDDVNDWDVVLENKGDSDTETMLQQLLGLVS